MKVRTFTLTFAVIALFAAPVALAASPDATTVIRYLDPMHGKYQIELENTSGLGYINTFAWVPSAGLTLTAVTQTVGGRCHVVANEIQCTGAAHGIAPPVCTCRAGGFITVTFTATGYLPKFDGHWIYYGIGGDTRITQATPVDYQIPSTIAQVPDLPVCPLGTQPDPENPTCVVE